MQRRQFLESLALSAVALPLARAYGKGKDASASSLPQALGVPDPKPYKFKPSVAKLPAWTLATRASTTSDADVSRQPVARSTDRGRCRPSLLLWQFRCRSDAKARRADD
jgi:hypothetical protein